MTTDGDETHRAGDETADEQDRATWRVDDVAAEVAQPRARGVVILDIDAPEMGIKTVDGIADVGHAYAAWFVMRPRSEFDPRLSSTGSRRPGA